ncbi:MAG: hypothetical protein K2N78_09650 [Oscillospiraceae bacterium]|nr:hypothetical protein [Oscillospiraceae bacterium]
MDTTKVKGLWEKVKDFFKNMSKTVRIILAAVLAVLLIAVIVTVVLRSQRNGAYVQLYENLTVQEAGEVADYLRNNGYNDFQLTGGNQLMVRSDQYNQLVGQLALAGYPKSGSLYRSYWENAGMMSTTSQTATAFLISTQERTEAILRTLVGVQDAKVTITPGEDRTFVLQDDSTETGASVVLTLQNGATLDDTQVDAIRRIVSKAWEGLTIDNVEVMDQYMNAYLGSSSASSSASADLQRYMEQYWINRIRTAVIQVLEDVYGPGKVKVAPNVHVEVDRVYQESTTYRQPEGSYENAGLIGRELGWYALNRDGYELVGGVPGTTTNADIPSYIYNEGQNAENGDTVGTSFERDNKIDETYEQRDMLGPRITNVTIAVTIDPSGNRSATLSVEELRRHVAIAAGIGDMTDEELQGRVSVLMSSFYTVEEEEPPVIITGPIPAELMPYVIIGAAALLLLIIILIVVLIVRSKKKKKQRAQAEEDQRIIEEQLREMGDLSELGIGPNGQPLVDANGMPIAQPPEGGADIMEINTEKSMELRKTVRQFVQNNPEVAAQMLKTWLRGEEDGE